MCIVFVNNYQSFVRLNKYHIFSSSVYVQNRRGTFVANEEILGKKPLHVLEKIRENLERLNEKMEVMIELQKHGRPDIQPMSADAPLDVMTLLSMPDHLRKTAMTICRSGRATAEEISQQTSRARAVESAYLNQLVLMGYLKKERKGRKAYFYADRESQGLK
jgi:hypothetical protein